MKKRAAVILTSILLILTLGGTVSAYTAEDVFTALEEANVPEVYVLQAEAYFETHPMSETQANLIMQYIDAALVIADGKTKVSELTSTQRGEIFQELVMAGQVFSLVVTYEGATNYEKGAVYVRDTGNNNIFIVSAEDVIKHTGFDYSIALYGLLFLVLAGAAGAVVYRRMGRDAA